MRTLSIFTLVFLSLISCTKSKTEVVQLNFNNFNEWWAYYNSKIILSSNFKAKDSNNKLISKKQFLDSLKSGNYLPINESENEKIYVLQKIDNSTDRGIISTIKQVSEIADFNYSMEGKELPNFNWTDLKGNNYTNENTKEKTIFLKTYFIKCQACNEEMPELNKFVENSHNPNYLFVSLALDNRKELEQFLANKNYKYNFVADQENYIDKELKSNIFPTHFIIENGIIKKVVNNASELIGFTKTK